MKGVRILTLLAVCLWASVSHAAEVRPNLLLIVLDDAGYSDVAGFGRDDAPTPNLRALASEGVRFTRHYADSTCRPARVALLTGREAGRVVQAPDFRGISPEVATLPKMLKPAGYHSYHYGKWHLGDSIRQSWPDKQGFDSWFGFLNQFMLKGPDANGEFTKRPTYLNPWLQGVDDSGRALPLQQYQGHLEDLIADRVVDRIRHAPADAPWFINYWLLAPHHPTQAAASWLAQYPDTPAGKYRALLAQADAEIGRVITALRETKQLDHTMIVVVSDNGSTNEMMDSNSPYAGTKGGYQEGSLRTPLIVRWPDRRKAGSSDDTVVGIQDIAPTLLAAAGIAPPAGLDGRDLSILLDPARRALQWQPRELIHEISTIGRLDFSVLSANGEWRLSTDKLYHLTQDAASSRDVAAEFPQVRDQLLQDYQRWKAGNVPVGLLPLDGQPARFAGDSFRRTPGYGAWSFAIGVRLPEKAPDKPVALAEQLPFWSLRYTPQSTLDLTINGQSLQSTPLPEALLHARCVPLVVSTFYLRSRLERGRNQGNVQVFADNRPVLGWQQDQPPEVDADMMVPTLIGSSAGDAAQFPAALGEPHVFNAQLTPGGRPAFYSVEAASAQACNSLH